MPKLSLSRAWDETRQVLSRDGRLIAAVALAIVVLPQTVIGLFTPQSPAKNFGLAFGLLLASLLFGFIAQVAINRLGIGPSTTVGAAIMRGVSRMPALLGAFLLMMIALFIILIPIVLVLSLLGMVSGTSSTEASPAVVLIILLAVALSYAVFQLAVPAAAAEDGGPLHLLKRSWRLAKGNYLRLLGFVAMMFIGLMIVLLAGQLVIGSIIAAALGPPDQLSLSALLISLVAAAIQALFTVVFAVMLARIYTQLAGRGEVQASVPSSGI
ncbi:MAG TPA: hypothetical protein VIL42_01205 [Sphingomicrobium sp.]|jgi:hypothetical protein